MSKFQPGDRVRRIKKSFSCVNIGDINVVDKMGGTHVFLVGVSGSYDPDGFELIVEEKPKPWLKVTPPQPEKRELTGFNHGLHYWMNFSPDSTFAYIGWGPSRGNGENQSFTKDELKRFGETLISISEEMK